MEMSFIEYIDTYYNARDRIYSKMKNPIQRVMEADGLPCDAVKMVDGELQKVVYLNDDGSDFITVVELITYTKDEVEKINDKELKEVYYAYMDNVHVEDVNIKEIINSAVLFQEKRKAKQERLALCTG